MGTKFLNATAIFDGVSKKVYATVKNKQVLFSKDDYLLLIVDGTSYLVRVLALEINGEETIATFDYPEIFNWSSGSELAVAIKTLPKSKQMEKPYATIDVSTANVDNEDIVELKQKIENGLTFQDAVVQLDTSSQATVTFNEGNPKTMMDTFVADKVKAKFSKKGLFLVPGKKKGQFISNSVQERLLSTVLWELRQQLLTRDEQFVQYTLSAIDRESNVIINNQKIKDVRLVKKNGNKEFRINFNENHCNIFDFLSGECTILIDKKNVEKLDWDQWYGAAQFLVAHGVYFWNFADDDQGYHVYYNKKFSDDSHDSYLEFPDYAPYLLNNGKPSLVTVNGVNVFGTIQMDKDNKIVFVQPFKSQLWGKKMASIKPNGYANLRPIEVGSPAKNETLQLKVDLVSFKKALEISKNIRSLGNTVTLAQLSSVFGPFKVTNAIVSFAKPSVKVTNAAVTLAPETLNFFGNYFEILFENEKYMYMMTMCDGFGKSMDLPAREGLNAIVSDITKTKEQRYKNLVALSLSNNLYGLDNWFVAIDRFYLTITNAEITRNKNGYKFQFHYNSLAPELLLKAPDMAYNLFLTKKIETAG